MFEIQVHNVLFSQTKQAKEIIDKQLNTEGMSVREISVARRKARLELKRQSSNGLVIKYLVLVYMQLGHI